MIKNTVILFILFTFPAFAADDQVCPLKMKNIPATTPTSQFTISDDLQIVTDNKTGLMWTRCPWGYVWQELGGCAIDSATKDAVGASDVTVPWLDALHITELASDNGYFGISDWRMPNIKELTSIIERQCASLALNQVIFGASFDRTVLFWSNSHVLDDAEIWVADFSSGRVSSAGAANDYLFRLVKDVP